MTARKWAVVSSTDWGFVNHISGRYHNRNRQRYIRCPWEDISYLWKYLLNGYKQRGSNFIKWSLHPPPSKADIICGERNNIKVGLPYTWEVLWYQLLWEDVHCNLSSKSLTLPGANRHRCFHHLSGESELGPWPRKHRLSGGIIVTWLEPWPGAFIAFGSWIIPGITTVELQVIRNHQQILYKVYKNSLQWLD